MRRNTIMSIIGVAILVVATGFFITSYTKSEATYRSIKDSVADVNRGDSESNFQMALERYETAAKYISDPAVELRILFSRWSEIQKYTSAIARTIQAGNYEDFRVEKKLEHFKLLLEDVEKRTKSLITSEDIAPGELWRANNLMGCIKLYKTLLIQEKDEEKREKQMEGLFNEALQYFENAIDVIQENRLIGIQTNIPQWNLEKLLKKQEGENGSDNQGEEKESEEEKQGEKEKEQKQEEQLKRMIPFLDIPEAEKGVSPGALSGLK